MKYPLILLIFFLTLSSPFCLYSAESNQEVKKEFAISDKTIYEQLSRNDFIDLNKAQIEAKIGRKLKLKEKLIFKAVRRKLIKHPDLNPEKALDEIRFDGYAILGFATSIAGLFFFGIIFGAVSVIVGSIALHRIENSEIMKGKGFAVTAVLIGWVNIISILIFMFVLPLYWGAFLTDGLLSVIFL